MTIRGSNAEDRTVMKFMVASEDVHPDSALARSEVGSLFSLDGKSIHGFVFDAYHHEGRTRHVVTLFEPVTEQELVGHFDKTEIECVFTIVAEDMSEYEFLYDLMFARASNPSFDAWVVDVVLNRKKENAYPS